MEVIDNPFEKEEPQNETANEKVNRFITSGYNFRISDYVNQAWALFKNDIGNFVLFTVVFLAITTFVSFIPVIGAILVVFMSPALSVGYFIVARKIAKGEEYGFNNFFDGFRQVLPLFLGQLVSGILVSIGIALLIIPGIYLSVAYIFTSLFIWFMGEEFWNAMELSRKLISKKWFSVFGFVIILALINLLGLIALGVGILFTIPITMIAIYLAFDDVMQIDSTQSNSLSM